MIFIAIVVLIVLILRFPKIKGLIGELYVAAFLKILTKDKYTVINNLLFTWNGHSTQIDHIVVSIYGIFVIETKYYKGLIYGGENSEYWLQNIYGNKHQFRNPILQNQGHIRALKHLLHEYEDLPFISIIAFSSRATLHVKTESTVIHFYQLYRTIRKNRNKVITEGQVRQIHSLLIANKTKKKNRKEATHSKCKTEYDQAKERSIKWILPKMRRKIDSTKRQIREILRLFQLSQVQIRIEI